MDLFNSHLLPKQNTVLHLLCKLNHFHLYDGIMRRGASGGSGKEYLDVNLSNELGETPLMVSINEKSSEMLSKVMKDFAEEIDFEEGGNSYFFTHEGADKNQSVPLAKK